MRTLVIAVAGLVGLGGCSFLTAKRHNDPRVGCSRAAGRVDAVLAVAGVAGIVTLVALRAADPPGEGDHGNQNLATGLQVVGLAGFSLFEAIQAGYGLRVADRCQTTRAQLRLP